MNWLSLYAIYIKYSLIKKLLSIKHWALFKVLKFENI